MDKNSSIETQVLPKISIITAVYNGEKYLEETIKSVINQTYDNVEYIVIDGGSTDGTLDIIKKYENYIDYWVSEKDKGIYDAMNKGIKLANGDIIGIINADDWYEENIFEDIAKEYIKYKKKFIYFGNMRMIGDKNEELFIKKSNFLDIKKRMSINHPTVFISKDIYTNRQFDVTFKITGDYEFFLYLYKLNTKEKLNFINKDLVVANMRTDGISDNIKSIFKVIQEDLKARKLHLVNREAYMYYIKDIVIKLPKKIIRFLVSKTIFRNLLIKRIRNKNK